MASDDAVQRGMTSCLGEILVSGTSREPLAISFNRSAGRENRVT
jgi:hypothetical protein